MNEGKLGKTSARILGIIMTLLGLSTLITQEFGHEGNRMHSSLNVSGDNAIIIGSVVLIYGIYILYVSFKKI